VEGIFVKIKIMKKVLVVLLTIITMSSWKNPSNNANLDTLVENWNNAWNKHDAATIANMMNDDVRFVAHKMQLNGKNEVVEKFVKGNYKIVSGLKTEKIASKIDGSLAVYFGNYHHNEVDESGKVTGSSSGNFTLAFQKNKQNVWKLSVVELEEYPVKK
jgi:uncharacterized protein (TIGR02246 family)